MKKTLFEQFGRPQGILKKPISETRIQKLLKKKRQKKFRKNDGIQTSKL
jgi:hypothetical protein